MCPLADFLQQSLLDVHLSRQQAEPHLRQVLPSASSLGAFTSKGLFLSALCSSPLSRTLEAISHLSSAGRHIIRSLHPVVPSVLIRVFESTWVGFGIFFQSWTQGWGLLVCPWPALLYSLYVGKNCKYAVQMCGGKKWYFRNLYVSYSVHVKCETMLWR